ncbi:MAG TPA: GtrA family protein [Polyangiales bacterium]|nr:GtrA family protein [Polyangiales bacterium]
MIATFVRHQAGSLAATVLDFSTMIGAVQLLHVHPAVGTACGAALGGGFNFLLGRHWIFPAGESTAFGSALRYALVSFASLGLNTAGEWLLVSWLGVQYVRARLLVAIAVSVFWNFPMQRSFVYRSASTP